MKNSGECIKCKGRRLWIVDQVMQPDFEHNNCSWKMAVTSHDFRGPGHRESRVAPGSFQIIVCAGCGYTEWYAHGFERLKDIPGARLIGDDSNDDAGPYR
jgi:hypothetical protein